MVMYYHEYADSRITVNANATSAYCELFIIAFYCAIR